MSTTHFGFQTVTPQEKTRRVKGVFSSVARHYDLMNDLMSGGIHRLWKKQMVAQLRLQANDHVLDVAGGTGDIAFKIQDRYSHLNLNINVCDLTPAMVEVGQNRAINRGLATRINWVSGNAECLPLPDQSVDVYTIAFGLRNVTHTQQALEEAARVLKPGGRFACLEFSKVEASWFEQLYDHYSFKVLPLIGQIVAKDRDSYQYLVESIRKFPAQAELKSMLEVAGFKQVSWQNFASGISCLHMATK